MQSKQETHNNLPFSQAGQKATRKTYATKKSGDFKQTNNVYRKKQTKWRRKERSRRAKIYISIFSNTLISVIFRVPRYSIIKSFSGLFQQHSSRKAILPRRNARRRRVCRLVGIATEQDRYTLVIKWIQTVWQRRRRSDGCNFRCFLLHWLLCRSCTTFRLAGSDKPWQSPASGSEIRKKRLKNKVHELDQTITYVWQTSNIIQVQSRTLNEIWNQD